MSRLWTQTTAFNESGHNGLVCGHKLQPLTDVFRLTNLNHKVCGWYAQSERVTSRLWTQFTAIDKSNGLACGHKLYYSHIFVVVKMQSCPKHQQQPRWGQVVLNGLLDIGPLQDAYRTPVWTHEHMCSYGTYTPAQLGTPLPSLECCTVRLRPATCACLQLGVGMGLLLPALAQYAGGHPSESPSCNRRTCALEHAGTPTLHKFSPPFYQLPSTLCDSKGWGRAHHMSRSSLEPKATGLLAV